MSQFFFPPSHALHYFCMMENATAAMNMTTQTSTATSYASEQTASLLRLVLPFARHLVCH